MNIKTKIVITGGPSGGKTTLVDAIQKDLAEQISVVPEAASILYRGGFPRKSGITGKKHTQRAIYYTQQELEALVAIESKAPFLVCDRGSLDSIAYWPGTAQDFFESIETTMEKELARYDWIIHLDTAQADSFDTTNPIRTESYLEASLLNEKISHAWSAHPQRIVISNNKDFFKKMSIARSVVMAVISGKSFEQVKQMVQES